MIGISVGDLWSYDYYYEQFIVSPEPDVSVVTIDPKRDRCIILATDGLWNMLSPKETVQIIEAAEQENERHFLNNVSLQIGVSIILMFAMYFGSSKETVAIISCCHLLTV